MSLLGTLVRALRMYKYLSKVDLSSLLQLLTPLLFFEKSMESENVCVFCSLLQNTALIEDVRCVCAPELVKSLKVLEIRTNVWWTR
jgi:hypothetical protein